MSTISRLTGEDVSARYEALDAGQTGPIFVNYQANDRQMNRLVRIQVLRSAVATPANVDALAGEILRISRLSHPALERIVDVLNVQNTLAIVFEARRGANLKDRIDRIGAFPVPYALDIAIAIAEVLQNGHRNGIAHGALDVSAVHLSPDGIIKVSGMGLDRAASGLLEPHRTTLPDPRESAAEDVAALGRVFFHLLTGQDPASLDVGGQSPQTYNRNVPAPLSNLVSCLVARTEPYRTIDSALHDLRGIRDAIRTGRPMPDITPPQQPAPAGGRQAGRSRPAPQPHGLHEPSPTAHRASPGPEPIPTTPVAHVQTRTSPLHSQPVQPPELNDLPPGRQPGIQPRPAPAEPVIRRRADSLPPRSERPDDGRPRPARPEPEDGDLGPAIQRRPRVSLVRQLVRSLLWGLFLISLVPVGLFGALIYYNTAATTPEITMPDLHGMPLDAATAELRRLGLKIEIDPDRVHNGDVPPGGVLTQSIEAGMHTKSPRTVRVTVSSGSRMVKVPSVVGKTIDDALKLLENGGLQGESSGEVSDPAVPNGYVIRQSPLAGQSVLRGSHTSVIVSAGPSVEDIEALSPSTSEPRTVTLQVPPDLPGPRTLLPAALGGAAQHTVEIREVDESGQERSLWHGTAAAGATVEQDVTIDAYNQIRVYLDGKEVRIRFERPEDTNQAPNTPSYPTGKLPAYTSAASAGVVQYHHRHYLWRKDIGPAQMKQPAQGGAPSLGAAAPNVGVAGAKPAPKPPVPAHFATTTARDAPPPATQPGGA